MTTRAGIARALASRGLKEAEAAFGGRNRAVGAAMAGRALDAVVCVYAAGAAPKGACGAVQRGHSDGRGAVLARRAGLALALTHRRLKGALAAVAALGHAGYAVVALRTRRAIGLCGAAVGRAKGARRAVDGRYGPRELAVLALGASRALPLAHHRLVVANVTVHRHGGARRTVLALWAIVALRLCRAAHRGAKGARRAVKGHRGACGGTVLAGWACHTNALTGIRLIITQTALNSRAANTALARGTLRAVCLRRTARRSSESAGQALRGHRSGGERAEVAGGALLALALAHCLLIEAEAAVCRDRNASDAELAHRTRRAIGLRDSSHRGSERASRAVCGHRSRRQRTKVACGALIACALAKRCLVEANSAVLRLYDTRRTALAHRTLRAVGLRNRPRRGSKGADRAVDGLNGGIEGAVLARRTR